MNKDIVLISLATSTLFFFLMYVVMFNKFRKSLKQSLKLSIDNVVMQEYIDILRSKEEPVISDELIDKENFIKFLSDSRDWAYKYIEDVQEGLLKFVNGIEPEIAYFDEYGVVGEAYPHYHSMKKISQEYKELKKLLPVEGEQ